jgi:hypothetical protein
MKRKINFDRDGLTSRATCSPPRASTRTAATTRWDSCQTYAPEVVTGASARAVASGVLVLCPAGLVRLQPRRPGHPPASGHTPRQSCGSFCSPVRRSAASTARWASSRG